MGINKYLCVRGAYIREMYRLCVSVGGGGFHYNPFINIVVLISRMDNSNIITARPHKPPRQTHYA
jgi:hypothetical protein